MTNKPLDDLAQRLKKLDKPNEKFSDTTLHHRIYERFMKPFFDMILRWVTLRHGKFSRTRTLFIIFGVFLILYCIPDFVSGFVRDIPWYFLSLCLCIWLWSYIKRLVTRQNLIAHYSAWAVLVFLFWASPTIYSTASDVPWYLLTVKHNEEIYLYSSQEIDAHNDIHAVKGCEALPCDDQNSISFRVRPTLFNHMWSLFHNSGNIFYADFVAGAVSPVINRCIVTSYGMRFKLLMRGFDWYPDLIKVSSCNPIHGGNK